MEQNPSEHQIIFSQQQIEVIVQAFFGFSAEELVNQEAITDAFDQAIGKEFPDHEKRKPGRKATRLEEFKEAFVTSFLGILSEEKAASFFADNAVPANTVSRLRSKMNELLEDLDDEYEIDRQTVLIFRKRSKK